MFDASSTMHILTSVGISLSLRSVGGPLEYVKCLFDSECICVHIGQCGIQAENSCLEFVLLWSMAYSLTAKMPRFYADPFLSC